MGRFKMASSESEGEQYEVAQILGSRKKGRIQEYLVRWEGYGEEEDTWEPARNLAKFAATKIDEYNRLNAKTPAKAAKTPAKTPRRQVTKTPAKKSESTESTSSIKSEGGRTVTKTTTTTTRTVTTRGGEMSSDDEGTLTRRSTRQQTVPARKPAAAPAMPKYDVPIVIFVAMMMVIVASFIYESHFK